MAPTVLLLWMFGSHGPELGQLHLLQYRERVQSLPWVSRSCELPIDLKIGAATAIDPDSLAVESPGLPLHTRRTAALIDQPDSTTGICRAEIPLPIVRRTGDRSPRRRRRRSRRRSIAVTWPGRRRIIAATAATPNHEIRPAAPVYPDSVVVIAPGLALNARRTTALVHHAHPALRVDSAIVALHIVGSARNVGVVQRSGTALRGGLLYAQSTEIQQRC